MAQQQCFVFLPADASGYSVLYCCCGGKKNALLDAYVASLNGRVYGKSLGATMGLSLWCGGSAHKGSVRDRIRSNPTVSLAYPSVVVLPSWEGGGDGLYDWASPEKCRARWSRRGIDVCV